MRLIQNISSTLKTWVFKKRVLAFSSRFEKEPLACFNCPEMCRFSCPVAETLHSDTVTPRGKMSILHLMDRGFSDVEIAGSSSAVDWFLDQCSGCGACTENCIHEVDVGARLRRGRQARVEEGKRSSIADAQKIDGLIEHLLAQKTQSVLFCEPGRKNWWAAKPQKLTELGVDRVIETDWPTATWAAGNLSAGEMQRLGSSLRKYKNVIAESPELAWFLGHGLKREAGVWNGRVTTVWQKLFGEMVRGQWGPDDTLHESWFLTRRLPGIGFSIPMFERGFLAFHSGCAVWDCGGEGHFRQYYRETAQRMGRRFFEDLLRDGRKPSRVVCQSLSCVGHLAEIVQATDADRRPKVVYWLDEIQ